MAGVDSDRRALLVGAPEHGRRTLRNAHLLDEHTAGRFRFHDLIRQYARHRAETEEMAEARDAALDRLFAWYFVSKQAATARRGSTRRQPPHRRCPAVSPSPLRSRMPPR